MVTPDVRRRLAKRATAVLVVVMSIFTALLFRYFHLMVVRHEEFLAAGQNQTRQVEELRAFRGSLTDRKGRDIALTQALTSVAVDPSRVVGEDRDRFAREVGAALDLPTAEVREHLEKDCSFRWLRRLVRDPRVLERLGALGWDDAIILREELARSYPNGRIASQVVGFTDVDGKGVTGLESALDQFLAPRSGHRTVLRDGWSARRISTSPAGPVVPPEDGDDVTLALELAIQTFAEEALDGAFAEWSPSSAVAVVLDPRNGDVLALASRPTFDPETRKGVPAANFRIRAATDAFPPGSTMKPLIAAAALDEGAISWGDTFDCTESGVWRCGKRRVRDHGAGLGVIPFEKVIIESSNIGAAQIALRLGIDRTWRLLRALGLNETTGSGLPMEADGILRPREKWTEAYTLCSVGFGQEMAVTPLQFAAAFASLLNGGILYRPRVVMSIGDQEVPVLARRQIYSEDVTRRLMVPLLVRVVEEGTGKTARIPGYSVGGKTGTAQKLDQSGDLIGYVSSFVGFAPAEDPRFLVLVLLDEPSREKGTPYGGRCAAPAVREILSRCLNYAEIAPVRPVDAAVGR